MAIYPFNVTDLTKEKTDTAGDAALQGGDTLTSSLSGSSLSISLPDDTVVDSVAQSILSHFSDSLTTVLQFVLDVFNHLVGAFCRYAILLAIFFLPVIILFMRWSFSMISMRRRY